MSVSIDTQRQNHLLAGRGMTNRQRFEEKSSAGDKYVGRPPSSSGPLIAGALGGRLRLLHPLAHLSLDSIKIEARAALHRREVKEGLDFLGYDLLNEHSARIGI
jgi:hypothetical protein